MNNAINNPITEDDIANYLANTPDFFQRHAELLAAVQFTSPHSNRAVGLQERQAEMLREKIKSLEQRIMEMIRHGSDNVMLSDRILRWARSLIMVSDFYAMPGVIEQDIQTQFSVARFLGISGNALFDLGKPHAFDIAQHRSHQTLVGGHRDADIGIAVIDHIAAIHRGIDDRVLLQCVGGGLGKEAHEAQLDAVGLFELLAQLLAHLHDLGQIDFIERGQHRNRVFRLHQAFGDAGTHTGHRDAFFRARAATHAGGLATGVVDDVFLGHHAATAGAGDIRRIYAAGGGGKACAWRQAVIACWRGRSCFGRCRGRSRRC